MGVSPDSEQRVSRLLESVLSGPGLSEEPSKTILLGSTLSRSLGVDLGAEVALVTQAADGTVGNDLYRVKGVFQTGITYLDRSLVLIHLQDLQDLLAMEPWQIHEVAVRLDGSSGADPVALEINRAGLVPGIEARSWGELLPQLREYLEVASGMGWFIISLVGLFAGFGTLNTMMMAVFERTREFGTLTSLGMSPGHILVTFLLESILLGVVGLLIGLGLGVLLMLYLANQGLDLTRWMREISLVGSRLDPVLRAEWTWEQFIWSAVGLMLAVILATLIPAVRAARMDPVKAIHESAA
jgi:ABC-type lipoprotein release transport system permease subunit